MALSKKILNIILESDYFNFLIDHELVNFTKESHVSAFRKALVQLGYKNVDVLVEAIKKTAAETERTAEEKKKSSAKAREMNLKHIAYGFYSKSGEPPATHRSEGSDIIPTTDDEYQKQVKTNADANPTTKGKVEKPKAAKGGDTAAKGAEEEPAPPKPVDPESEEGKKLADKGWVASELYHDDDEEDEDDEWANDDDDEFEDDEERFERRTDKNSWDVVLKDKSVKDSATYIGTISSMADEDTVASYIEDFGGVILDQETSGGGNYTRYRVEFPDKKTTQKFFKDNSEASDDIDSYDTLITTNDDIIKTVDSTKGLENLGNGFAVDIDFGGYEENLQKYVDEFGGKIVKSRTEEDNPEGALTYTIKFDDFESARKFALDDRREDEIFGDDDMDSRIYDVYGVSAIKDEEAAEYWGDEDSTEGETLPEVKGGKQIDVIKTKAGSYAFDMSLEDNDVADAAVEHIINTIPADADNIVFVGAGEDSDGVYLFGEKSIQQRMLTKLKGHFKNRVSIVNANNDRDSILSYDSDIYKQLEKETGAAEHEVRGAVYASMIAKGGDPMAFADVISRDMVEYLQKAGIKNPLFPSRSDRKTLNKLVYPDQHGGMPTELSKIVDKFNSIKLDALKEKISQLESEGKIAIVASTIPYTTSEMKDMGSKIEDDGSVALDDISPIHRQKVSAKINELAELGKKARSAGKAAPNFNLCKVTIPGTNLFCGQHKGIDRVNMPQFKGTPVPGSKADKLPKDKDGEVDAEAFFQKLLKDKGVDVSKPVSVPPEKLKATQSELVGVKVAGMSDVLEDKKHPAFPKITAPIYVSKDGYVLDGHHRWASIVAYNIEHPEDDLPVNVKIIDMDIVPLVNLSNQFASDIGIASKAAKTKPTEKNEEVKPSGWVASDMKSDDDLKKKTNRRRGSRLVT